MVHISKIELFNFKSFGGTTKVPFFPEFTVISGPNGSGKSNILDALLFCLGLASSKGMRAERLPDLVNHNQSNQRKSVEAGVSVTFDLSDLEGDLATDSWKVTRRLRVTPSGSYTSSYYINEEACNLNELHQQLNRLRIYPEGYNVVLQGDVTRIITMNSRERREIIDELAGVAEFDRKIEKTKQTLAEVRETEEKSRIIEQELIKVRDRLAADKIKAEKYQQLKQNLQEKRQWEIVINWQLLQEKQQLLETEIKSLTDKITQTDTNIANLNREIEAANQELTKLNQRVKTLGEDEQLSLTTTLVETKAKLEQNQQRYQELQQNISTTEKSIISQTEQINIYRNDLEKLQQQKQILITTQLPQLRQNQQQIQEEIRVNQEKINELAQDSEQLILKQSEFSNQITTLQTELNNHHKIAARDTERCQQLQSKITENQESLNEIATELITKQTETDHIESQLSLSEGYLQSIAQDISVAENSLKIAEETNLRLTKEQRENMRKLDKLEAQQEAQQEAQGTYASSLIMESKLTGVHGLVVQLGRVEPEYQLALEIAGGGRLGYLVVDNDQVAATGIQILKEKRGGRATFLPLNKINPPYAVNINTLRNVPGYIDLAVNLIECEGIYKNIFAYVFGNTVVFEDIETARRFLGQYRIVTLTGEILETSGAMTGGSQSQRNALHFGTVSNQESEVIVNLRQRLGEIEAILTKNQEVINRETEKIANLKQNFSNLRQQQLTQQLKQEQLTKESQQLLLKKEQLTANLTKDEAELKEKTHQLQELNKLITELENQNQNQQEYLKSLEGSEVHKQWQHWQNIIKNQEAELALKNQEVSKVENELRDVENQSQRLVEKISEAETNITQRKRQQEKWEEEKGTIRNNIEQINQQIATIEAGIAQLSTELITAKQERDRAEEKVKQLTQQQQEMSWQLTKLRETKQTKEVNEEELTNQIHHQEANLPQPLPEIPLSTGSKSEQLATIQAAIDSQQKRIESMEPVNMLALEEYETTQNRLENLSEKLTTLEAERTELLLRIETFTTARLQAFQEAFDAVNENFQEIFATLSEGDGYLQLDNANDPFDGGLNLIAHPKGKPVQRLSSMSGGEKSLTALSFIFALQKYRPSPFYAFDEVDMFLDGANVEKLAKMIKYQALQAQFIVVSLRRPMIEASSRTIGVTQARGKYTQVLGIKL